MSHLKRGFAFGCRGSYWPAVLHKELCSWNWSTVPTKCLQHSRMNLVTAWCWTWTAGLRHYKVWYEVRCFWNVMAHAQKPDFVFRRNGRVHLNRRGHQFSRLLATEVCASAVVMLDTPCSEVVWRVLATHSIRQFPLHFPSVRYRVPSHFNWILQSKTKTEEESEKQGRSALFWAARERNFKGCKQWEKL